MYDEMMDTIGLVNQADPELAAAMGSILTNKYAEGLSGCGGFLCRVFCAFFTNFCGRLCAEPNKTGANL